MLPSPRGELALSDRTSPLSAYRGYLLFSPRLITSIAASYLSSKGTPHSFPAWPARTAKFRRPAQDPQGSRSHCLSCPPRRPGGRPLPANTEHHHADLPLDRPERHYSEQQPVRSPGAGQRVPVEFLLPNWQVGTRYLVYTLSAVGSTSLRRKQNHREAGEVETLPRDAAPEI